MTNPLYLIEADFGRIGRAFIETDRDQNSRDHAISLIRSGEVKPIKVLEVCEDEGTCRDVTEEICGEASFSNALAAIEDALAAPMVSLAARIQSEFDHAHDLRKHEVA